MCYSEFPVLRRYSLMRNLQVTQIDPVAMTLNTPIRWLRNNWWLEWKFSDKVPNLMRIPSLATTHTTLSLSHCPFWQTRICHNLEVARSYNFTFTIFAFIPVESVRWLRANWQLLFPYLCNRKYMISNLALSSQLIQDLQKETHTAVNFLLGSKERRRQGAFTCGAGFHSCFVDVLWH